jgi:hypothetical protein
MMEDITRPHPKVFFNEVVLGVLGYNRCECESLLICCKLDDVRVGSSGCW